MLHLASPAVACMAACPDSQLAVSAAACRRFTNTLAVLVWLSVAWIAYEMYYKVSPRIAGWLP